MIELHCLKGSLPGLSQFLATERPSKMMNNVWYFFLSEFSFVGTENSQENRGREGTIFITLCFFHTLTNIQTFNLTLNVR